MCLSCIDIVYRAIEDYGFDQTVTDLLESVYDTYNDAWTLSAKNAVDKAIDAFNESPTAEAGLVALLASLESSLNRDLVTQEQYIFIRSAVRDAYSITKKQFAASMGGAADMTPLDISLARKLADDGPYWIGSFYDRHLSNRIAEVANDIIIERGYGRVQAAKVMDQVLRQEFSLYGGKSIYAAEVPASFAGNLGRYNRILVSNVAGRVRNFGHITAMDSVGVERFRFVAVMDERTSEVCQEMDGREFSVRHAMDRLSVIAETEDPEAFKELAPWPRSADYLREVAGTGTREEQNARLEQANFTFPPLHGECRSVVEQVV